MHKLESIIENKTHKILRDFEIQTDHQIPGRISDQVLINKNQKTYHLMNFAVPADHGVKIKENEKRDKYLARELKKIMEHKGDGDTYYNWCVWNGSKRLVKELEIGGRAETNTTTLLTSTKFLKKSLENLRLPVTQTPVKDYQLTLV